MQIMEIKIFFIWFIQLAYCGVLIKNLNKQQIDLFKSRFKRSANSSAVDFLNLTVNSTNNQSLNLNQNDKQVHFTTPRISTDKWIPLLNNNSFHSLTDNKQTDIDKRIDESNDDGLIRINERFDPIQTSASDHLLIKNYNGYKSSVDNVKKEPQVQYEEQEALASLNELEKKLRDQLDLLERHRKIYNQLPTINPTSNAYLTTTNSYNQQQPTTATKYPIVHYDQNSNEDNSFRSFNSYLNSTSNYQSNREPFNQLQDVYAKINFQDSKEHSTNDLNTDNFFKNLPFQTMNPIEPESNSFNNQQQNLRPVKPTEVFFSPDKDDLSSKISGISNLPPELYHKFNGSHNPYTNSFMSTYQPPIDTPTFATSQPDNYTHVHNHLQSNLQFNQFKSFKNNQLQPYLYRPLVNKNSFPTATPLQYSTTINSLNPSPPINSNGFNQYPSNLINQQHQQYTNYYPSPPSTPPTRPNNPQSTVSSFAQTSSAQPPYLLAQMAPQMSPQINPQMTTHLNPQINSQTSSQINPQMSPQIAAQIVPQVPQIAPQLQNATTFRMMPNEAFEQQQLYMPNSPINMSPQMQTYKTVPYSEQTTTDNNMPAKLQYNLNVQDKPNYVFVNDNTMQSTPVSFRGHQFPPSPTTTSTGLGSISSSEMNNNLRMNSNQPLHVINNIKAPVNPSHSSAISNADYVKVYDDKTNEMYFIKANDFNHFKMTNTKLDHLMDYRRPTKDYYEPNSESTRELLEAVKMAVIKVKPFKSMATRAVTDLASKLKDHLRSFASSASYSSFPPYSGDLTEFSYDTKRDPIYLQHYDEYSGKVVNGQTEKPTLFNQMKGGYAKPDFLSDDHLHMMEPISLNSDRNTVKQNLTNFIGRSSFDQMNRTNSIEFINPTNNRMGNRQFNNLMTNQTANFASSKQKIDHYNKLIEEQKRLNTQKQQSIQLTTQSSTTQSIQPVQPTQYPASTVIDLSPINNSSNSFIKPGQTRYITRIAIKPNRAPIVQHFKYVQSVNLNKPITISEQPVQTFVQTRPIMNNEQMNIVHLNEPLPSPVSTYQPMGLPRNYYHQQPVNKPIIHHHHHHDHHNFVNPTISPTINPTINPTVNPLVNPPEFHHFNKKPFINDQQMIVQESKPSPTYTTTTINADTDNLYDNLTDYSLFPTTDFLRITNLTNSNKDFNQSKKVKTINLNGKRNSTTSRIKLPEFNFQYNPRFLPPPLKTNKIQMTSIEPKNLRKHLSKKLKMKDDRLNTLTNLSTEMQDELIAEKVREYNNMNNMNNYLSQNLFQPLLSNFSFEPFASFDSILPPTSSFTPTGTSSEDWFLQALQDQMIDIQNPDSLSNSLSSPILSPNNQPSIKYNPQSQLISISSLPPILQSSSIDNQLQQNSLPFTYSSVVKAPNLFINNLNNEEKLNQIYQPAAVANNGKQGQSSSNQNKLNNKSSSFQPNSFALNNLEFLGPIKNKLQKIYQRLIDGQTRKSNSQITVNFLNNRQEKTKNDSDGPVYRVLEFNEKNLREVLNGEEDAELLHDLLTEEKGERRFDLNNNSGDDIGMSNFGFNKRTLNIADSIERTNHQKDEDEKVKQKRDLFEDLLLKLSKLTDNKTSLSDTNDLATDQSTLIHSIDDLTADDTKQIINANTSYRQLIDHFRREHKRSENQIPFLLNEDQKQPLRMESTDNKQFNKLSLLTKLFNRTSEHPNEKAIREKTHIEFYEKEHLFDDGLNEQTIQLNDYNQTANNNATHQTIRRENPFNLVTESSVKTNSFIQYQPSATWFTPTIVYDDDQIYQNNNQIKDKNSSQIKLSRQRFGLGKGRKSGGSFVNKLNSENLSNSSKVNSLKSDQKSSKSQKTDNSKSESKAIENRQLFNQSPILFNNTLSTKPNNLLKTKEKGIKIITEFELIHKDLTNSSNKEIIATKIDQKPTFKVKVIDNGFQDLDNNRKDNQNTESLALKKEHNLTFIDGSTLETNLENSTAFSSWNNDDYLDDIRKQIKKEWPTIDENELEKIVKQFASKDVVNVSTFSPILNYDSDQKNKNQNRRNVRLRNGFKSSNETNKLNSKSTRNASNRRYNKPFIGKDKRNERFSSRTVKSNQKSLDLNTKNDYKSEQSQSELTVDDAFPNGDFEYDQHLNKKDCNKTETENEELNSKILGQINSLLEQQFSMLRDELKANKTEKTESYQSSTVKPFVNSETGKIKSKFKSLYIPEDEYNIEQVNGVKRVINKPFISNILEQKKFNTIFKVKPTKSIKNDIESITEYGNKMEEELVEQSKPSKVSVKKDKFKIENEDGKLNIGDYDSLY